MTSLITEEERAVLEVYIEEQERERQERYRQADADFRKQQEVSRKRIARERQAKRSK